MRKKSMVTRLMRSYGRQMGQLAQRAVALSSPWTGEWAKAGGLPVSVEVDSKHPWVGLGRWLSGGTVGAGGPRSYNLFVPTALDLTWRAPAPLMVMLHGCTAAPKLPETLHSAPK